MAKHPGIRVREKIRGARQADWGAEMAKAEVDEALTGSQPEHSRNWRRMDLFGVV
jgi:hypothetical protein